MAENCVPAALDDFHILDIYFCDFWFEQQIAWIRQIHPVLDECVRAVMDCDDSEALVRRKQTLPLV